MLRVETLTIAGQRHRVKASKKRWKNRGKDQGKLQRFERYRVICCLEKKGGHVSIGGFSSSSQLKASCYRQFDGQIHMHSHGMHTEGWPETFADADADATKGCYLAGRSLFGETFRRVRYESSAELFGTRQKNSPITVPAAHLLYRCVTPIVWNVSCHITVDAQHSLFARQMLPLSFKTLFAHFFDYYGVGN